MADSWFPTAVISHFYSAVYTGSHSMTVVFGVITVDGEGLFERYERFTKDEFVDFLQKTYERFGRMLIIAGRAP